MSREVRASGAPEPAVRMMPDAVFGCGVPAALHPGWRMRGFTVPELLMVMMVAAMLMAVAIPRAQAALDRTTVRSAAADVRATIGLARAYALSAQSAVAVDIDTATGQLRLRRGAEVLLRRPVGEAHGVRLVGTRDSLSYDAHGLGLGAANLSVVIRRRSAAETVFVSRLGRVR